MDEDWILGHPEEAARDAARRWDAIVTLKGAITFIAAPDGRLWRHHGGNIGLATSGSGDVLSGLIAEIAARGATTGERVGNVVACPCGWHLPRASGRLAAWRAKSPAKCRRSCKHCGESPRGPDHIQ